MNRQSTVSLIAAVDRHGAIGRNNALLWHDPEDQRHFRRVTLGCPVIMGRKTWDSLPPRFRPLPGRRNIVVTRNTAWRSDGAEAAASLNAALAMTSHAAKVFVIGGAQLYAQALPQADELLLTEIDAEFDADAFFPAWDRSLFRQTVRQHHTSAQGVHYSFVTYTRTSGG